MLTHITVKNIKHGEKNTLPYVKMDLKTAMNIKHGKNNTQKNQKADGGYLVENLKMEKMVKPKKDSNNNTLNLSMLTEKLTEKLPEKLKHL